MRAEIITTKAKDVLVVYTQAGKAFLLNLWESGTALQVKNFCKEGAVKFSVLIEKFKSKISDFADIKGFYYALVNVFSKKCKNFSNCFDIIIKYLSFF